MDREAGLRDSPGMKHVGWLVVLAACGSSGDAGDDAGGGVDAGPTVPTLLTPRTGITADQLGVLVNDADPLSVQIATYYAEARGIPAANIVHLTLPTATADAITEAEFTPLSAQVTAALAATDVQALAITWTKPYRVGNTSITSAFAYGYKAIANTCTDPNSMYAGQNPYNAMRASTAPFTDAGFRPAMTLPATTFEEAKALIDRGIAADDTWPTGSAYMMSTSDQTRSARCVVNAMYGYQNECQKAIDAWDSEASGIAASIVMANSVMGKTDVMFYVQGLASVPDLATNTYLPGAVADHLTSYGGQIPTSGQMSAIEFLRAGATGSYGTTVEPCAYTQKFPNPKFLMPAYFGGATLIEAYWKSVEWPAEGIFIGEPLARPFGSGFRTTLAGSTLTVETTVMVPNVPYLIEAADAEAGPYTLVQGDLRVPKSQRATFTIEGATRAFYRFRAQM